MFRSSRGVRWSDVVRAWPSACTEASRRRAVIRAASRTAHRTRRSLGIRQPRRGRTIELDGQQERDKISVVSVGVVAGSRDTDDQGGTDRGTCRSRSDRASSASCRTRRSIDTGGRTALSARTSDASGSCTAHEPQMVGRNHRADKAVGRPPSRPGSSSGDRFDCRLGAGIRTPHSPGASASHPCLRASAGVPSAWLVAGGLGVVAPLAQAATVLRVVGIQAPGNEVTATQRVVVGDGARCELAQHADRIPVENCHPETTVTARGVATLSGRTAAEVCTSSAVIAPAAGGQTGTAGDWADLASPGHQPAGGIQTHGCLVHRYKHVNMLMRRGSA